MSRMHAGIEEYGRARQSDSSSSRESSPRQAKKRSFSPTSDDGDLVIPPIAYDDTPPPQDRPLLRQPVAFAWTSSTSATTAPAALNTYQIAIPPATEADFLPGQKVVLPPAPLPRKRKKKGDEPSKKRKKPDYEGHTNRFRLQPYDASSSVVTTLPLLGSSSTPSDVSGTPTVSAASPSPTLTYPHGRDTICQAPALEPPAEPPVEPQVARKKAKQSTNNPIPSVTKWRVNDSVNKTTPSVTDFKPNQAANKMFPPKWRVTDPPLQMPDEAPLPTSRPSGGPPAMQYTRDSSYYRRDYESDVALYEHESMHTLASHGPRDHSPIPNPNFHEGTGPSASRNQANSAASSTCRPHDAGRAETRRPQKTPFLMLTLLIQDIRSGVTDHQLAEVRLPMKPANDPSEGFWADAKLLGQQLQSSASRIDGPAKVYTLRGKYRQFFLRVTAENVDEFISTHLAIKPDRMLDVVVETLLPPGQLPLPPKIPRNLVKSPTPESSSQSPTPERETFYELPFERQRNHERMMREFEEFRRLQQSSERAASVSSHGSLKSVQGGRKQKNANLKKRKRSVDRRSRSPKPMPTTSTSAVSNSSGSNMLRFSSPDASDSPDEVHKLVTEAVDHIIQEDAGWIEFFRTRAALQPHRAMDVLKQYQFVKRMIDQWAGQRAPFRSVHIDIEPSHITRALKIDEPNFASACVETLALLELYGPKGQHYEDSRVVEMINDTSKPEYNAKPIKRLLHLMQDIDKRWKEEHLAEQSMAQSRQGPNGRAISKRREGPC